MTTAEDRSLLKVGNAIAKARRVKGISQEELANKSGLDRSYMGRVERGERNPGVKALVKIAKGLGIKPSELLKRAGL